MQRGEPAHGGYPDPPVTFTSAVIRPGTARRLNHVTAVAMMNKIRERVPGLADVLIIGETTGLAAYRPDVETPGYVHRLLDAFLSGGVLNFGQEWVPEDVQIRLRAAVSSGILGTQAVRDDGS
jgi:hypothetical protein